MTVIAKIGTRVNLKIIFENLPHAPCGSCLNDKCKTCTINNGEIISIRYKDCEPKGKPIKKVAKRKLDTPQRSQVDWTFSCHI